MLNRVYIANDYLMNGTDNEEGAMIVCMFNDDKMLGMVS